MKKIWQIINSFVVNEDNKNRLFLGSQVTLYGVLGAAVWGMVGRFFLPGTEWLLCFIGYPAVFAGFFGGVLYLYNHEFNE